MKIKTFLIVVLLSLISISFADLTELKDKKLRGNIYLDPAEEPEKTKWFSIRFSKLSQNELTGNFYFIAKQKLNDEIQDVIQGYGTATLSFSKSDFKLILKDQHTAYEFLSKKNVEMKNFSHGLKFLVVSEDKKKNAKGIDYAVIQYKQTLEDNKYCKEIELKLEE